jgi:hypothetical protein
MFSLDLGKADDKPKWSGERGVKWLEFQQFCQGKLATIRAHALGRSINCSLSLQQETVLMYMKPDSIGLRDALGVWQDLAAFVQVAELGWFPPCLLPLAIIDRVKRRQPAGLPVQRILENAMQRCFQPMCQVAAAAACALETQNELDHVLTTGTESPALQVTVLPTGQVKPAPGFSRLKYRGRACSPDLAVMEMFWIIMHTMYAVSPQAEQEFYALSVAGSQGSMDIRAFAAEVERRYRCVEFVSGVVTEEITSIIVAGLNSQESREFGESRLEKDRQLTVDSLVEMLEERERVGQVKDLVTAKAARFGYVTGGSSKTKQQPKAGAGVQGQSGTSELGKAAAKVRKNRAGYLRQLQKENPPEYEAINSALDLLETYPSHPRSLCLNCSDKGMLHTKADCKVGAADKTAMAGMSVAGQSGGQLQKPPSEAGTSAAAGTPGLFRAPPKPPAAPKGSKSYGYQPTQQVQPNMAPSTSAGAASTTPCPVCQYPFGHPHGICFYASPNMATDKWIGPNRRTDAQLVHRYIEACAQQRVAPRLSRCGQTVEMLLSSGCLSPAAAGMLRQQQPMQLSIPATPHTVFAPIATPRFAPQQPQYAAMSQMPQSYGSAAYHSLVSNVPQETYSSISVPQVWQMQGLQQALPSLPQTPGVAAVNAASAYVVPASPMLPSAGGQQQVPVTPGPVFTQQQMPANTAVNPTPTNAQAFMANRAYSDPGQASSSSSGAPVPRGYGWCNTVVRDAEDLGFGAMVATRATTRNASGQTRRQPLPKSFVVSQPVLPRDPNSMRDTQPTDLSLDIIDDQSPDPVNNAPSEVTPERAWAALQTAMEQHSLSLQQLTEHLSVLHSLLPATTTTTAAVVELDDPIALMTEILQGVQSGGFGQAFSAACSPYQAESSHQAITNVCNVANTQTHKIASDPARSRRYAAASTADFGDVKASFPQELLFEPPSMAYVLRQQQRQGLDRLTSFSKREGITLVLPDGREILLEGVFHDSGANLLLVTEAFCKEIGLFFRQGIGVPGVRGWKGLKERVLLGCTDPFQLILAKGTSYETTLHVAMGYVVPGDAQGMYTLCLDKQTVFAVYGHVNPYLGHFVWMPWIARGDCVHLAGLPVHSAMQSPTGESANSAFATSAAYEQLQRIHSLTGLDPDEQGVEELDLMDLGLERVAEATLGTVIMMERQQRDAFLRLLAIDDAPEDLNLTWPRQQQPQAVQEMEYLGWVVGPDYIRPGRVLLSAPPEAVSSEPDSPVSSIASDTSEFYYPMPRLMPEDFTLQRSNVVSTPVAAGLSFRAIAGYFCLFCLLLSMLFSGAAAMVPGSAASSGL